MGWFFGFKLHLLEASTAALQGKVFADQGHLSRSLLERLRQRAFTFAPALAAL